MRGVEPLMQRIWNTLKSAWQRNEGGMGHHRNTKLQTIGIDEFQESQIKAQARSWTGHIRKLSQKKESLQI